LIWFSCSATDIFASLTSISFFSLAISAWPSLRSRFSLFSSGSQEWPLSYAAFLLAPALAGVAPEWELDFPPLCSSAFPAYA